MFPGDVALREGGTVDHTHVVSKNLGWYIYEHTYFIFMSTPIILSLYHTNFIIYRSVLWTTTLDANMYASMVTWILAV